jgi:hypothetical protein
MLTGFDEPVVEFAVGPPVVVVSDSSPESIWESPSSSTSSTDPRFELEDNSALVSSSDYRCVSVLDRLTPLRALRSETRHSPACRICLPA